MKIQIVKQVHEMSADINQFLLEKDNGQSISALIVSLSMFLKRKSGCYDDYLTNRKTVITRIMELTEIDEREFKDTSTMFKRIKDAA